MKTWVSKTPTNPAAALARERWKNATEAERDQPREAGKLGGRPAACHCGECPNCKRRAKRKAMQS